MDSLVNAAARALESGDPLGALQRVALRQDPAALELRGIALAARDLSVQPRGLGAAMKILTERGDLLNALHARLALARRALLVGRLDEAERELAQVSSWGGPARLLALHSCAGSAVRAGRSAPSAARSAADIEQPWPSVTGHARETRAV